MKTCRKFLAGAVALIALGMGAISCSTEPEIKYVEKEVIVTKYVCPKDKKQYDTAEEAANCCGVEIKEVEKIVYSSAIPETGSYDVYHYKQKTSGGKTLDDYVLGDKDVVKALTQGTDAATVSKTYEGFTEKAVSLNEKTIYVFYDRNTITYTFETGTEGKFDDGTTSKTVSGLYGASYTKPKSPSSSDYNFIKWMNGETLAPSVFGSKNMTFIASWKEKSAGGEPEGFVTVSGTEITGTETWTPSSSVFVSGRAITIPALIVSDHEVTRGEFLDVMGTDPSTVGAYDANGTKLTGDAVLNNPVNYVNWYDAIAYCNKLSVKEGLTPCYTVEGVDFSTLEYSSIPTSSNSAWDATTCDFTANGYRLPTEAEWEYLARGGVNCTYAGSNTVGDVAWYNSNTNNTGTREVKTKQANGYGLYDMSGNVYEWCWDWRGLIDSTTDAAGSASGSRRVQRGGSLYSFGDYCAVSYRFYYFPYYRGLDYGLRVVRPSSN
ncbi:formylglycine-generating enzyme family protein [Treponema sp.]|uniref:formylglycine-generating enzyme family protein n=1 Tax=Treponema sp. TaxID=166 RepID=UPI003FD7D053